MGIIVWFRLPQNRSRSERLYSFSLLPAVQLADAWPSARAQVETEIGGASIQLAPEVAQLALPPGFPILAEMIAGEIIEPVLLYLSDRYLGSSPVAKWRKHRNTAIAAANDLKSWWEYLYNTGVIWSESGSEHIDAYRSLMESAVSAKTREPYASGTIRRRLITILAFYQWADRSKLLKSDLAVDRKRTVGRARPIDEDFLPHLAGHRASIEVSELLPASRPDPLAVQPFTHHEAQAVLRGLGPLPSNRSSDTRSSGHRNAAELALATGMRIGETEAFTKWQLLSLRRPKDIQDDPYGSQGVALQKTKGLVPRVVFVPNWLVLELYLYFEKERPDCIRAGRELRTQSGSEPISLFVNGAQAGLHVGRPLRAATLSENFRRTVLDTGLTTQSVKIDLASGATYLGPPEARHSFHDLRHTFAVWLYEAERLQGNPEPWKRVQTALGHAWLQTTLNSYLKVTDAFERRVGDRLHQVIGAIARSSVQ